MTPDRREDLAEMMQSVEDIPRDAILSGLPWDGQSYPEYLDSVQRLAPALNVVGLVGHCAVRYHVMASGRSATRRRTRTSSSACANWPLTDVPNGQGRLTVGAEGYAATIVNGTVVTEQGALTGARPGRVLREFARE